MKRGILFTFFLLLSFSLIAEENPLWMRYPSISPDGKTIAFSFRGDLYTVSSLGGEARLLTAHTAYDFSPVWSPDGKKIAFASDRFGNFDVYVISFSGGIPQRLTFYSGNEIPTSFTPDSKKILFSATIDDAPSNVQFPYGMLPELYDVPVEGGRIKQILSIPAIEAKYNKTRDKILYYDQKGYEDIWRKHHTSSVTRDIWMYDSNTGKHTKLTIFEGEDRSPVFNPDESAVYFLSEQFGSFNVCRVHLDVPDKIEQITTHEKHPVRFLSIANDETLCYGYNGEIFLKKAGGEPQKVNIRIAYDEKTNAIEFMKLAKGATDMAVSPDGKEVAFIVRGEVFVTAADYTTTKQITHTPEQERSVSFGPDGKSLLYASERGGSWNLYQSKISREEEKKFSSATMIKEEPILVSEKETFQPFYSPDGKEVAYLEERTTLKVINLETKQSRTILEGKWNYSYSDGDQWYEWSPDGKWFLVQISPNTLFMNDVGVISADGKGEVINVTKSGYNDSRPRWMMDGQMLIWFTDRQGYRSHGSWGSERDVYAMFFTQEAFDFFNLTDEEYTMYKEEKEKKEEEKSDDSKEKGKKKKKEIKPVKIERKGIEDRIARLTINSSDISDAILTPDGEKLYYLTRFEKGHDLWVNTLKKKETKLVMKLGERGGGLQFDDEGETLFFFSGEQIVKVNISDNKKKNVSFQAQFDLDHPTEREYLFEHIWRQVKKKFYTSDLHRVDWTFYKKEYARFLPFINNNYDFAEMLSEMLGELNGSHTGCRYRPDNEEGDQTARLGCYVDEEYIGKGLKIAEIFDKSPLIAADSKIIAGHIIEKVDGTEILPNQDYFSLLNHKTGKPTLLTIYDPLSGKRWDETVKPISIRDQNELLYERWVKNRREETEKLSDGKIGYVHVRGMNSQSFREVFSEILGRNYHKDAIIVDTRFNGGGWLHDDLVTLLGGEKYAIFVPREQKFGHEPASKWTKKSAIIVGEGNYSDAHGFPYAYKALGIGKVIGMPIPGTMTAVWWERLQDNTLVFGIPQVGVQDLKGNYLENKQFMPDITVANEYDVVVKGRDQQLEKTVEILLKELE